MKKTLLSLLISTVTFSSFSSDRPDPETMTDAQIEHELELLEENGTERTLSTLSFDDIKNYKKRLKAFQSKVSSERNTKLSGKIDTALTIATRVENQKAEALKQYSEQTPAPLDDTDDFNDNSDFNTSNNSANKQTAPQSSTTLIEKDDMNEVVKQMYNKTLTESSLALASFFSNFDIYTLRTYVGSLNSEGSYQSIEKSLKPIILSLQEAAKKNNQTFTEQDARIFLKTTVEATLAFKEKRYKGFWAKLGLPAVNKFAHSFCLALFKTVSPDRYTDLLNGAQSVDDIVEVLSHIKKNPAYNQLSVHEKNEIQLAKANALKRLLEDPTKQAESKKIINADFENEELRTILQLTNAEKTFIGIKDIRTIKPLPTGLDSSRKPHNIPEKHNSPSIERTREIIEK